MTDDALNALNAERYSPANTARWWRTPASEHPETPGAVPDFDDSDVACARRRRAMVADFEKLRREVSA